MFHKPAQHALKEHSKDNVFSTNDASRALGHVIFPAHFSPAARFSSRPDWIVTAPLLYWLTLNYFACICTTVENHFCVVPF